MYKYVKTKETSIHCSLQVFLSMNFDMTIDSKVDRLYGWVSTKNSPIKDALKKQTDACLSDYQSRIRNIVTEFAEQGLNAVEYYRNKGK